MLHNCPHCRADKDEDGFGTLNENEVHECRCEECTQTYFLYIAECNHCLSDSVFAWISRPTALSISELDCDCCAHKIHDVEDITAAAI